MVKIAALLVCSLTVAQAADLATKKSLNFSAIKTMVAAAEAEAQRQNLHFTICIVDENGTLLFLEKMDGTGPNTVDFAQKKARDSAYYRRPSKVSADLLKAGNMNILTMPNAFPVQGGLPIKVDGQTIGAIACSGAKAEQDEATAQAGIDALMKQ